MGWEKKHQRRVESNMDFYRSAASTLPGRCRRKFTEKTSWYKESWCILCEEKQTEEIKKTVDDMKIKKEK